MTQPLDLWAHLAPLFGQPRQHDPEIFIMGLPPPALAACLVYLLETGRQITPGYRLAETGEEVALDGISTAALVTLLSEPPLALSAMFQTHLPALPPLMFYVEAEGCLSLSYAPGRDWNALTLLALFDFLQRLYLSAPTVDIAPDPRVFAPAEQILFIDTLRLYLEAHG
ncbi:MAG: hypothetical protein MUE40_06835 [Anaerolineae bacterium]|jgi:hypothetical protein|nr:hypothetical protein [Anaerolineae bacterium]